jgi:type III secretion protein X
VQAHLRELYPQYQMVRLRLWYASPEQELSALHDPQRFAVTLESLAEHLLNSQRHDDRQAAVLLQALLAERHMLERYANLLLKV